jgi:hypothetical protein
LNSTHGPAGFAGDRGPKLGRARKKTGCRPDACTPVASQECHWRHRRGDLTRQAATTGLPGHPWRGIRGKPSASSTTRKRTSRTDRASLVRAAPCCRIRAGKGREWPGPQSGSVAHTQPWEIIPLGDAAVQKGPLSHPEQRISRSAACMPPMVQPAVSRRGRGGSVYDDEIKAKSRGVPKPCTLHP